MKKRYWFLIGFVALGLIGAASDDKQTAVMAQPTEPAEAAVPPSPMRPDLTKPIWTRFGAPICVTREELEILIAGGESDKCVKSAREIKVTVSKLPVGFSDIMRIRVRNADGELLDYWTLHNALRN